jgi:LmeA-like phospholipid-binding
MRRTTRLVVTVVVIGGLLYGADRVAARYAADQIASVVQSDAHLAHRPKVVVKGFPFLTQVVAGDYRHIDVTAADVFEHGETAGGAVLRLDFAGVRIPASNALSNAVKTVPVKQVTGSVAIPFADLQTAAGVSGLSITGAAPGRTDAILATDVVKVGATGTTVTTVTTVRLTGTVTFLGNSLVVKPTAIAMANETPVPAAVRASVLAQAVLSVRLPGLPPGVEITGVSVTSADVVVTLGASNLVLARRAATA